MVEIVDKSERAEGHESCEDSYENRKTVIARSYENFIDNGHNWCWCLIGNIVQEHEYGEEHEIKYGTKQFSRGTKVFLAPAQWGDGYDKIAVIGLPRYGRKYIEVVTKSKYIENFRMQKVFKPAVLKLMCSSQHRWWGDTENDRKEIIRFLETRAPEEAEKQKSLLEN
ncbi:MAG: hypothetical protein ACI4JA_05430 [Oscillospiraceae bacterium]